MKCCIPFTIFLLGSHAVTINAFESHTSFSRKHALKASPANQDYSNVDGRARVVSHQDSIYSAPSVPTDEFANLCDHNVPNSNYQAQAGGNERARPQQESTGTNPSEAFQGPSLEEPERIQNSEDRLNTLKVVREQLELLQEFEGVISADELKERKRELFALVPKSPNPITSNYESFDHGGPVTFNAASNVGAHDLGLPHQDYIYSAPVSHQDSIYSAPSLPTHEFANHDVPNIPKSSRFRGPHPYSYGFPSVNAGSSSYYRGFHGHFDLEHSVSNADFPYYVNVGGSAFRGPYEDPMAAGHFVPDHGAPNYGNFFNEHDTSNYDFPHANSGGPAYRESHDLSMGTHHSFPEHSASNNGFSSPNAGGSNFRESNEKSMVNAKFVPGHDATNNGLPNTNASRGSAFRGSHEDPIGSQHFVPEGGAPNYTFQNDYARRPH